MPWASNSVPVWGKRQGGKEKGMATRRCRVRIRGPSGGFRGTDPDELDEWLGELEAVREEEWELTESQVERFLNRDGYVYVITVFSEGEPQMCFTQKELWEDLESFMPIINDPSLSSEEMLAKIQRAIEERRAEA
jgi:hypothetical protein